MKDPIIHSRISGELPDDHPLAFTEVTCPNCGQVLHEMTNYCVQTWVETGAGNFDFSCWIDLVADMGHGKQLGDDWGLD